MANELTPQRVAEILGSRKPKIRLTEAEPSARDAAAYAKLINDKVVGPVIVAMGEGVIDAVPAWVRDFGAGDSFWLRRLDRMSEEAKARAAKAELLLQDSIAKVYTDTSAKARATLMRQIETALRIVAPIPIAPRERAMRELFSRQNAELIKDISAKGIADVQSTVIRTVQAGDRPEDIAKNIRERLRVPKKRAELIARDQVGKLTSQLRQQRMITLGVTHYRWRTSRDERVRRAHVDREGVVFSWDNPPADGHPGQPIRCRCYAEPVLDGEQR